MKLEKFLSVRRTFSTTLFNINYFIGQFLKNSLKCFHVYGINIFLFSEGLETKALFLELALCFEGSTSKLSFRLIMFFSTFRVSLKVSSRVVDADPQSSESRSA
jgi:hypothetical protein